MNVYKNIKKSYFIIFVYYFIPAYVVERLFYLERGLDAQQAVFIQMVYALTIVVMELPSGILADKIGRKKLLCIGAFLSLMETVLLCSAFSFKQFALAVICAGISQACISGAWNALLYDSLEENHLSSKFESVLGYMQAATCGSQVLAGLLGSFLAERLSLTFTYEFSVGSHIVAFLFFLTLIEPITKHKEERPSFRMIIQTALSFYKNNKVVFAYILQGALLAGAITYIDEFWQIYFYEISIPVGLFGIAFTLFMAVRIPSGVVAAWLSRRFSSQSIVLGASLTIIGGVVQAGLTRNIYGAIGMIVAFFASELITPVITGYLQHLADDKARATIDSVNSLLNQLSTIGVGVLFGYVIKRSSVFIGFLLIAAVVLVGTSISYITALRREEDERTR